MLSLVNDEGESVAMPGKVTIMIGGSSPSKRSEELGAAKPIAATITVQ